MSKRLLVNAPSMLFLKSSKLLVLLLYTLSLKNPSRKNSGDVGSGDRGGQKPCPTMRSPKTFCKKGVAVFAVR